VEKLGGENLGRENSVKKVAFASFIGTAIEYYDFYIYGTAAALVFGTVFFPEFSPLAGTLASFATFGVAFFARPLGAAVFGHYGDKVGRKSMLIFSLLLMGFSTFLVGLLPGYAVIGVAAPLLLVVLRFAQGVGLGGEWGGAVLMAAEHAPPEKRGFYASWPQMGPPAGFLLSSGVFLLFSAALTEEQFAAWGWRVPFLLSIVLIGVGLFVRAKIAETPAFARVMESNTEARVPLLDVMRTHPKRLALASCAGIVVFTFFFVATTFGLSYGTSELGLSSTTMLYCTMIAIVFMGAGILVFAAASDRVGRRRLSLASTAFLGLWAFPMFWLINTANPVLITLALSVGMIAFSMIYGPLAAYFSELFGTRVRYSGAALSYALAGILGGSVAPLVATQLLAWTGASWSISLYVFSMAVVSFLAILALSETHGTDLSAERGLAGGKTDPITADPSATSAGNRR
jgi:metabolite-proton symporter